MLDTVAHGQFVNETSTPLTGAATFTGPSRDSGAASNTLGVFAYFAGFFLSDQAGTAFVELSDDGITFYIGATAAIVAATPLILQVPLFTRYHRVRLLNGATPQTTVKVNSSYTAA